MYSLQCVEGHAKASYEVQIFLSFLLVCFYCIQNLLAISSNVPRLVRYFHYDPFHDSYVLFAANKTQQLYIYSTICAVLVYQQTYLPHSR